MDVIPALRLSSQGFLDRAVVIEESQWSRPTPCEAWTVRDLVGHVASGAAAAAAAVRGATFDEVDDVRAQDHLGGSPVEALAEKLADQEAAFSEPGALDRQVEYFPQRFVAESSTLIRMRISDVLLHTWDLARSIGADESLQDDLVQIAWDNYATNVGPERVRASGLFGDGPSRNTNAGWTPTERLLDLTGRRF